LILNLLIDIKKYIVGGFKMNMKSLSELLKKDVFTDKGLYCGRVTDVGLDLEKFRVKSIIVNAERGSFISSIVGNKKGIVVPYPIVQSVGDIVIIKHVTPEPLEEE